MNAANTYQTRKGNVYSPTPRVLVQTSARGVFYVTFDGRVVCECTHRKDADLLAQGLRALNELQFAQRQNVLLQETLAKSFDGISFQLRQAFGKLGDL